MANRKKIFGIATEEGTDNTLVIFDGATVSAYQAGTSTPINQYATEGAASPSTILTDDQGEYEFWIDIDEDADRIKIEITKSGHTSIVIDDIFIAVPYIQDGGDIYYKDNSRGDKWLSLHQVFVNGARNNNSVTDIYLSLYDRGPSNLIPYVLPFDATLVGMTLSCTSNTVSWTGEVRKNGVAAVEDSLSIANQYTNYDFTKNTDFDAGDRIEIYMNGTSIPRPSVGLYFRRRKT